MNRRDLLLQEMQIPQWVLRKPQILRGEATIRLPEYVKLVVVCPHNYANTQLFTDIMCALQLKPEHIQWLNMEQVLRLNFSHQLTFWLIENGEQTTDFVKKFGHQTAWQTEHWTELSQPQQKRQLWKQMNTFLAN